MTTTTTHDARLEPDPHEKPPAPCGMPHELSEAAWREHVLQRKRLREQVRVFEAIYEGYYEPGE